MALPAKSFAPNVVRLQDQVDELQNALGQKGTVWPFTLTGILDKMFGVLMAREFVTADSFLAVMYSDRPESRRPTSGNEVSVHLSRLRKIVGPYGVAIEVKHGEGWYLPPLCKQRVRKMMEDIKNGVPIEQPEAPKSIIACAIEKNVPMPSTHGGRAGTLYPYAKMEPGDSFFVPGIKPRTMRSSAAMFKIRFNHRDWTLLVREDEKDGVFGVRVWRQK